VTLLVEYAHERLLRGAVVGAAVLVAVGAQVGRASSGALLALTDLVLSLCFVVSFRIGDDIMDRERDRLHHPERVVARARSAAPLAVAALLIGMGATAVLFQTHGPGSVSLVLVFSGALATWYALRRTRSPGGDRLLLFKYPVFTLALIAPAAVTPRGLAAALGVYLAACLYEWLHDRESPVFSFGGSR
jgi:4-hydroxybenzoate polyprenyltransferase